MLAVMTSWMGRNWFWCFGEDVWSLSLLCCGLNQRKFQCVGFVCVWCIFVFFKEPKNLNLFSSSHVVSAESICLGWWQPLYKIFTKRVSPVLQVAVCPLFFFPSLANLQHFVESHFSKNNVPARLESTGKSGDAEPMWIGLMGPCAGGLLDGVGW